MIDGAVASLAIQFGLDAAEANRIGCEMNNLDLGWELSPPSLFADQFFRIAKELGITINVHIKGWNW